MNMEIRPLPCPGAQSCKDTESFIGRKSLSKWTHHHSGCKSAVIHTIDKIKACSLKATCSRDPNNWPYARINLFSFYVVKGLFIKRNDVFC